MNKVKNDIEAEYELFPEFLSGNDSDTLNILFKHDYYSSDSQYGRHLLDVIIDVLSGINRQINLYFVDTGVKVLSNDRLLNIKSDKTSFYACASGIEQYEPELSDNINITLLTDFEFIEEIISLSGLSLFVIE